MKKFMENLICVLLAALPVLLIAVALIFAMIHTYEKAEQAVYNNGIHEEDGGKWELVSIYGEGNYYYACDKCGKVIHTYNIND